MSAGWGESLSRVLELDIMGRDVGLDNPYESGDDGLGGYPNYGDPADMTTGCALDGSVTSCGPILKIVGYNMHYYIWLTISKRIGQNMPLTSAAQTYTGGSIDGGSVDNANGVGYTQTVLAAPDPLSAVNVGFNMVWLSLQPETYILPQIPTMAQPSKPIPDLVRDLLKKGDCADYVQKLLDNANELFAGKYPHVNTISEAMDMISKAGGYQLDGKGYHTVSGDLFYKGGGAQPGTVHIIPFRTFGTPSAANVAYAQEYYAVGGLHETFHLARQGGYNDELMATAAFSLARKKLPTPPANLDGYGRAAFFSSLFDDELLKHCPKR